MSDSVFAPYAPGTPAMSEESDGLTATERAVLAHQHGRIATLVAKRDSFLAPTIFAETVKFNWYRQEDVIVHRTYRRAHITRRWLPTDKKEKRSVCVGGSGVGMTSRGEFLYRSNGGDWFVVDLEHPERSADPQSPAGERRFEMDQLIESFSRFFSSLSYAYGMS